MAEADARAALQRLIEERREDYSSLSRLLGRNAAYVQQYVKRGTPRRLAEEDRRLLARYFGVAEALLGGPEEPSRESPPLVRVPRLALVAMYGVPAGIRRLLRFVILRGSLVATIANSGPPWRGDTYS